MEKLEINLENCYGIKKLNETIDFTKRNSDGKNINACLIYAPNGTMKTSLANTFKDIENDKESKDRINFEKTPIRDIKIDNRNAEKDDILVIESYVEGYDSDKKSKLLVCDRLKKEYDNIFNEINNLKNNLFEALEKVSGIHNINTIESEIVNVFKKNQNTSIFQIFEMIEKNIQENDIFNEVKYEEIINSDAEKIIEKPEILGALDSYLKEYNNILEKSSLYKPGVYDNTKANITLKALKDNNFFKANHKVLLETNEKLNEEDFEKKIKDVENEILNNETMKKKFNEIEKVLSKTKGSRSFKDLIYKNKKIIPLLVNYNELKKQLWLNYLSKTINEYKLLLDIYKNKKSKIVEIIAEANNQHTIWQEVTNLFNNRFKVPFEVSVSNKQEVILKEDAVYLEFNYKDGNKKIDRNVLEECLSFGEKKALYILNILYELKARSLEGKECLIIFDDVADSFDYKNKYAIIEYINDIMDNRYFKSIILTHNFDFYRSLSSRLELNKNNYFAIKHNDRIILKEGQYTKNIFQQWKNIFCILSFF